MGRWDSFSLGVLFGRQFLPFTIETTPRVAAIRKGQSEFTKGSIASLVGGKPVESSIHRSR
jgi:hypothetical protein